MPENLLKFSLIFIRVRLSDLTDEKMIHDS